MKLLAGAVLVGAFLMASALPAVAGGYWDAQPAPPPPPQYAEGPPPCHQGCGPPPPCGCWQDRGYHQQAFREEGPPPPEHVVLPAEFFADGESSVGPAFLEDEGYSSGGAVEAAELGNAEAFASASASARVDVNVRVMQHIMQRNHMMQQRHMQMRRNCGRGGHR